MNRCKECGCICPDFSDVCDCCAFIEEEERLYNEESEIEDEEDETM